LAQRADSFDLSDTEVSRLFDRALPGLRDTPAVPVVTGNRAIDARIAVIARERGYRPRGSPIEPMGSYAGWPLQQRAIDDLVDLQRAMRADTGASLSITSSYRGVASQRAIFLRRLGPVGGYTTAQIEAGAVDAVLDRNMRTVAPPGFSKHHTGYAIDVASGGYSGFGFRSSRAWDWLTDDGYANAMKFGWIPSYPDKASAQGPNPEPWEWVWIGRDAAACARDRSCAVGAIDHLSLTKGTVAGWAADQAGDQVVATRLVSDRGTDRLKDTSAGTRFDLDVVFGGGYGETGFSAETEIAKKSRWVCLEARTKKRGPWSRVDCEAT